MTNIFTATQNPRITIIDYNNQKNNISTRSFIRANSKKLRIIENKILDLHENSRNYPHSYLVQDGFLTFTLSGKEGFVSYFITQKGEELDFEPAVALNKKGDFISINIGDYYEPNNVVFKCLEDFNMSEVSTVCNQMYKKNRANSIGEFISLVLIDMGLIEKLPVRYVGANLNILDGDKSEFAKSVINSANKINNS